MSLWNSSSSPADPKSEIVKPPSLFEGFHSVPPWKSPTWFHEVMLIALALVAASWLDSFFDIVGLPLRCFRLFLGISFWVLWQRGLDRWPVVLLSSMLSVCMARLPADLMPAIAVAVVEVVCLLFGVWFVRRLVFGRNPGARLADALKFVLAGSLLASALSAFLSTALMVWLDPVSRDTWSEQFVIRWLAEALSILLSAPIGFAWWNWSWRNRNERGRWWELLLFVAMLGVLAVWTFARNFDANSLPIPDLVLVVPVSFWALVRWGSRGNSVATFAISIMSVLAALHERGPFVRDEEAMAYSALILALGSSIIFSATTLLVSALMCERQEAVTSLQKMDVRFQILFKNSPDAVFVIDMQTEELLEFNHCFPKLLRCTRDELRGRRRSDFELDASDMSLSWGSSVLSVTKSRTADVDTQYRCADGEIIDVNVTFSVIDFLGKQAQLMIARDVTARRREEQQLRESEETFRVLAEAIPALVMIQRGQLSLYVNPAMMAVSGFSREEFQKANFLDLLRDAERAAVFEQLQQNPAVQSQPWQREVSLFTKAGNERKVELTVTPIRLEGRHAWLASAVDVTERLRAEAELRQLNAELFHTARLRLLGEFVAGVAHDLKHPIGAIDLLSTAILNRLAAGAVFTAEELREEFEMVLSQAQKGIKRIRRLEDLARRDETERRMIDLPPLVHDAIRLVRLDRRWSEVPIKFDAPLSLPKVYVDRPEMTQVLLDLFRNSLEAMEETPPRDRQIAVTIRDESPGYVRMTVTDFGCGIPDHIRSHMFKAFYSTKPEGLGLGLSLCHTVVVERHRGKLKYEPARPRGSTFHILLPTDRVPMA